MLEELLVLVNFTEMSEIDAVRMISRFIGSELVSVGQPDVSVNNFGFGSSTRPWVTGSSTVATTSTEEHFASR